jgi:hypothetical protein
MRLAARDLRAAEARLSLAAVHDRFTDQGSPGDDGAGCPAFARVR